MIGNREVGEKFGIKPRVRIIAGAIAGVEPRVMGLGPVFAIRKALARANLTLADMDVIEINEALQPSCWVASKCLKSTLLIRA